MISPTPLCRVDDVPEDGALAVDVDSSSGGFTLIVIRGSDGVVRAFHNECPHAGRPLDWAPGKFLIQGDQLICAAHGAAFSRDSGACLGGPCRGQGLMAMPLTVEDGAVYLAR